MKFKYKNKKITGVLTIVPKKIVTFEEEMDNYQADKKRTLRLKKVMGYEQHRIVDDNTCISDLAVFGMNYLFDKKLLKKEDIGAVILVTLSPDYFMPATSNVIHGILRLPHDVLCMDISQGCAGYIVGLMQSFAILDQLENKKVVLINADVLSRKTCKEDRNSWPLIGDAASITIIENAKHNAEIIGEIKFDGTGSDALKIPAGGFKIPSTPETAIMTEDDQGNKRSLDNLVMNGGEVFHFMQTVVPPFINELLNQNGITNEEINYYLFHQPNKFMVEKLADAMDVPYEKMPSNIVTYFGNASGVTIPTNICYNLGDKLLEKKYKVCLAGFGVGLTWGAIIMELGNFHFCDIIEF